MFRTRRPGAGPFTTYRTNLRRYIQATRDNGGIPVLITPMERRRFDAEGRPKSTLAEYAEAVRQVGDEGKAAVIDLNAMSLKLYAALGPEGSTRAFVHDPAGTFPGQSGPLRDDTHHNAYGGYELARCVVEGIRERVLALAPRLASDVGRFDPSRPDPPDGVGRPRQPSGRNHGEAGGELIKRGPPADPLPGRSAAG